MLIYGSVIVAMYRICTKRHLSHIAGAIGG